MKQLIKSQRIRIDDHSLSRWFPGGSLPGGSLELVFGNDIRAVFLYGLLNDLWVLIPNTYWL